MEYYDEVLVFRIDALQEAINDSKPVKIIVIAYEYIIGVEADGIIGYLSSYPANNASNLVMALQQVHAPISANIAKESLSYFPNDCPASNIDEREAQIDKIMKSSGLQDPWEELNKQLFANLQELKAGLSAYVLEHQELVKSFPEDNDQKKIMATVMKKMKRR